MEFHATRVAVTRIEMEDVLRHLDTDHPVISKLAGVGCDYEVYQGRYVPNKVSYLVIRTAREVINERRPTQCIKYTHPGGLGKIQAPLWGMVLRLLVEEVQADMQWMLDG